MRASLRLARSLEHALSSLVAQEDGGANGKCMVIDTEGAFRPERLQPIAERFGLDADAVLENVTIARAFTSEHQARHLRTPYALRPLPARPDKQPLPWQAQAELLDQAAAMISEDQYRALIIDSATALFRVDYQGRGELSTRQQALNQFLSRLTQLATVYNLAVFITNQARPRIPPPARQLLRKTRQDSKAPKPHHASRSPRTPARLPCSAIPRSRSAATSSRTPPPSASASRRAAASSASPSKPPIRHSFKQAIGQSLIRCAAAAGSTTRPTCRRPTAPSRSATAA